MLVVIYWLKLNEYIDWLFGYVFIYLIKIFCNYDSCFKINVFK